MEKGTEKQNTRKTEQKGEWKEEKREKDVNMTRNPLRTGKEKKRLYDGWCVLDNSSDTKHARMQAPSCMTGPDGKTRTSSGSRV